jgi:hypothetical protein
MTMGDRGATVAWRPMPRRALAGFVLTTTMCVATGCGGSSYDADHPDPEARVVYREASWVIDPTDKVQLAQWAEEIFIGTVVEKTRTDGSVDGLPSTEYRVRVDEVVEGDPPAVVTIAQEGGYTDEGDRLLLIEGDELFHPGESRLFAATVVDGVRSVFPVYGSDELTTASEEARAAEAFDDAVVESEDAELPPGLPDDTE